MLELRPATATDRDYARRVKHAAYKDMVPVLDRYVTKGQIHKNKAARHKSRLAARIKALA